MLLRKRPFCALSLTKISKIKYGIRYFSGTFSVSRLGLLKNSSEDDIERLLTPQPNNKEKMTHLGRQLLTQIKLQGAIPLHEFISQALHNPIHGYYQHKKDKIGDSGDFITSPEISQLFGEMLTVWCVSIWISLGKPKKIKLIELGPGNGTLIKDMLKVAEKFPSFLSAVTVHLVELSPSFRKVQRNSLGAIPASEHLQRCTEENLACASTVYKNDIIADQVPYYTTDGVKVIWHSFMQQIPHIGSDKYDSDSNNDTDTATNSNLSVSLDALKDISVPEIIIGQEFLDAFPVHQFTSDLNPVSSLNHPSSGSIWHERLVDIDSSESTPLHFRLVLSRNATPAVSSLLHDTLFQQGIISDDQSLENNSNVEILGTKQYDFQNGEHSDNPTDKSNMRNLVQPIQRTIEVSPMALSTCQELAKRVQLAGGAALIIDYGENYTQSDTLRGFHKHTVSHPFSQPGQIDITADVDFGACRRAAQQAADTYITPVVCQGSFLMQLGIVQRVQDLINRPEVSNEYATALVTCMKKLVQPEDMGQKFKVMAICNNSLREKVPGFNV